MRKTGEENKRARMTIINQWLCHNRRFTARTQGHYSMVINRFSKYIPLEIEQLSSQHIEAYINDLLERSSNRTANAHLTAIKSFCRWLSKIYDLPNPAAKIKMLKEDPPKRTHLSRVNYLKALEACKDGEADIIKLIANSGLRASEVVNLNGDSIFEDKLVIIGKGRKRREISLNATLKELFSRSTHIHFSKNRTQLYRLCQKIGKQSGVKISPQILRRYFANRLSDNNVPLSHLMLLLGHSSLKTTQAYLNSQPDLSGVTDCLDSP